MTLPLELYADPRLVLERIERGDVLPVRASSQDDGCLACVHQRPGRRGPWCALNNQPSPSRGRCRRWAG